MGKERSGLFEKHSEKNKGGSKQKTVSTLLDALAQSASVPFHMPGHKRNPQYEYLNGIQSYDITEIAGFDNLHDAKGILKKSMEQAANLFGVKYTRYLINGGSGGILAAVRAATKSCDTIALARNCHKSVYHAVEICGLTPSYIVPQFLEEYGIFGSVMPDSVEKHLLDNPNVKTVVITSPTYEGIISDIASIADVCHKHGAVLIVDEAHGAHLGLSRHFPQSARKLGADIVINSLHKTLPSLTQTAMLHICSDRVSVSEIDANLAMFETSSPSYPLISSIDGCVNYLRNYGANAADRWSALIDKFYKKMGGLRLIKFFGDRKDSRVFAFDKSKLVIITADTAISGVDFAGILRYRYNIELEMASEYYAIAMTGMGDVAENFTALATAVIEIDSAVRARNGINHTSLIEQPSIAYTPAQARALQSVPCDLELSEGKICAEYVWAYPPGSPIIVPGEIISTDFIRHATQMYECGINVTSSLKGFPESIMTVSTD